MHKGGTIVKFSNSIKPNRMILIYSLIKFEDYDIAEVKQL